MWCNTRGYVYTQNLYTILVYTHRHTHTHTQCPLHQESSVNQKCWSPPSGHLELLLTRDANGNGIDSACRPTYVPLDCVDSDKQNQKAIHTTSLLRNTHTRVSLLANICYEVWSWRPKSYILVAYNVHV